MSGSPKRQSREGGGALTQQQQPPIIFHQGGPTRIIRQSHGTDVANLLDSQNSIFDKLEGTNSYTNSQNIRSSNPNTGHIMSAISKTGTLQQHLQQQNQQENEPEKPKTKTFREILDSIDEQENNTTLLNTVAPKNGKLLGSTETLVQSGTIDFKENKNQYDAYCIQANKTSNAKQAHLLATRESNDTTDNMQEVANKKGYTKLRPQQLASFKQESEGVLSRSQVGVSLKNENSTVQQPLDSYQVDDQNKRGSLASIKIADSYGVVGPDQLNSNKNLTVMPLRSEGQQSPMATHKQLVTTPQGIEKRVMPGRLKLQALNEELEIIQANSVDPNDRDTMNSIIRGEPNHIAIVQNTHRVPVITDQRVPPLTDDMNTNLKNLDTSQMSMNINSTFRQTDENNQGEEKPNCYLLLPWDDIALIVESINDDNDQMKIYFGCKALNGILQVTPIQVTRQIIERFSKRLIKRLVIVLSYEHLPDAMAEVLNIVVLLTNLMDYEVTSEMVVVGLIHSLNKFIDQKFISTRSNIMLAEHALQIVTNVTQISNLAIVQMQKEYIPDFKRDDEGTMPGLNFIDRMISLCQLTEAKVELAPSPRVGAILETDENKVLSMSVMDQSAQVGCKQMAELRIQLSYICKHILVRKQELEDQNIAKVAILLLEIVTQSNSQVYNMSQAQKDRDNLAQKLKLIWQSVMVGLRMICGSSELVCAALNKHPDRKDFAKSLISIVEYCVIVGRQDNLQLLMDTLIVIGDLTASERFSESAFFVDNNMFSVIKTALTSKTIGLSEPIFNVHSGRTYTQVPITSTHLTQSFNNVNSQNIDLSPLSKQTFQETIMWIISNAVADDLDCQDQLIQKHWALIVVLFGLVEEVQSPKINHEIAIMIDNILQNDQIKDFLFQQKKTGIAQQQNSAKKRRDSFSSYKESDREMLSQDSRYNSKVNKPEQRFIDFLTTLAKIIDQFPISVPTSNDELDYLAIKNVMKIFKLRHPTVVAHVIGRSNKSQLGMPLLIEGIYKLQHHWSMRVYQKAILLSQKYLSGNKGPLLHNMTDIFSDLCQQEMADVDPQKVERTALEMSARAKKKMSSRRKSQESSSDEQNSEEEEAQQRALTFLMSAAEKRAFAVAKKHEKEFNERFKKIFVTVVSSYLKCTARPMRVIDMTGGENIRSNSSLNNRGEHGNLEAQNAATTKHAIKIEQLDLDMVEDSQHAIIPKPLIAYRKFAQMRKQMANQKLNRDQLINQVLGINESETELKAQGQSPSTTAKKNNTFVNIGRMLNSQSSADVFSEDNHGKQHQQLDSGKKASKMNLNVHNQSSVLSARKASNSKSKMSSQSVSKRASNLKQNNSRDTTPKTKLSDRQQKMSSMRLAQQASSLTNNTADESTLKKRKTSQRMTSTQR